MIAGRSIEKIFFTRFMFVDIRCANRAEAWSHLHEYWQRAIRHR